MFDYFADMTEQEQLPKQDLIRILYFSDNHLGLGSGKELLIAQLIAGSKS